MKYAVYYIIYIYYRICINSISYIIICIFKIIIFSVEYVKVTIFEFLLLKLKNIKNMCLIPNKLYCVRIGFTSFVHTVRCLMLYQLFIKDY